MCVCVCIPLSCIGAQKMFMRRLYSAIWIFYGPNSILARTEWARLVLGTYTKNFCIWKL